MPDVSFDITAPALGLPGHSETEVLGAVTWLWMHSLKHRSLPLIALSQTLLTPLKAQQFMLLSEAGPGGALRPVAYLGWGQFRCRIRSALSQSRHNGASAQRRLEQRRPDVDHRLGHAVRTCAAISPHRANTACRYVLSGAVPPRRRARTAREGDARRPRVARRCRCLVA